MNVDFLLKKVTKGSYINLLDDVPVGEKRMIEHLTYIFLSNGIPQQDQQDER
jgi:hypothetical protein